ncbi:MAG: enoyl-CoA hydratase/isomerase family protein, partial [Casimicrobiaceae bacterium]
MTPDAIDGPPTLDIAGAVATIRLRRPAEHNRIDPDDVAVVRGYLETPSLYPAARAMVFTGTGDTTFSSGYTIDAIVERLDRSFEALLDTIEQLSLPTICALNGSVYGGATDLALCCDFRLGVRGSRMFMPAAKFGLHYYPGGLRRAVEALGAAQAKRVFLTAQTLDAEEMLHIGFLTELVDREALDARVAAYVAALGECEPAVVKSMKRQIRAIVAGDGPNAASRSA